MEIIGVVFSSGTWYLGLVVTVAYTVWVFRHSPRTVAILVGLSLLEGVILMTSDLSMLATSYPPARNILSPQIYLVFNGLVPVLFLGAVISFVRRKQKKKQPSWIAALPMVAAWSLQSFYLMIVGLQFLFTGGVTELSATSPDGAIHVMVIHTGRNWEGDDCLVIARRPGPFLWHPVGDFGRGDAQVVEDCRVDWTVADHVRIWAKVYSGDRKLATETLQVDAVVGAE